MAKVDNGEVVMIVKQTDVKEVTDEVVEDFKALLALLESDLARVDHIITHTLGQESELIPLITNYLLEAGGKRLRPLLVIVAAKAFGYEGERHHNLAAVVELIHSATLLHDDVVDDSELRRGRASAKAKWGNKASILVGDFLFSRSFELMVADQNLEVLDLLSKTSRTIALGEVIQLEELGNLAIDTKKYYQIIEAKTAVLFATACRAGAMIGGAGESVAESLYQYGMNLGYAFQIIDDTLDYSAKDLALGKKLGDDFMEGKVTLPLIMLYEQLEGEDKAWLDFLFIQGHMANEDLDRALEMMNQKGISTRCKEVAEDFLAKARNSLINLPENIYSVSLNRILDFTLDRLK